MALIIGKIVKVHKLMADKGQRETIRISNTTHRRIT